MVRRADQTEVFSQVLVQLRDPHPNVVVENLHWTARKHLPGLCMPWDTAGAQVAIVNESGSGHRKAKEKNSVRRQ